MITILLNVIWLIFGGAWMAIGWFIAGILMVISIVGIPFARAAFTIGLFALWPFGRWIEDREKITGIEDIGTGPWGTVGNVIWLIFAGWWLALGHIVVAFCLAMTLIGIPFAWAHLKLAMAAIWPIGKSVIDLNPEVSNPFRRSGDDGGSTPIKTD